ncbi:hypothetical protein R3W88_019566 [Solanum pinnatisectum]|uniref:Endonuclease/exonuclease/phosphatase domain-containing protein n=1 Tax=Solanum pinnatisectum TaxID=50273 RepID=A0AAV9KM57_9SOLN|nr:hypothetical protein R3W88_019566 [Solanum pinnatisectum]
MGIGNFIVVVTPTLRIWTPLNERPVTMIVPPNSNRSMTLIIWNCRGCNNKDFHRNFRSLIDWHKPPPITLVETKMSDHQVLIDEYSFTNMIQVPSVGNSRSLVLLWDDNILEVDNFTTSSQEIHTIVKVCTTNTLVYLAVFMLVHVEIRGIYYGTSEKNKKNTYNSCWLIGDDFNLMSSSDKSAGRSANRPRMFDFWDTINQCELIDLGFKGGEYTWLNKSLRDKREAYFRTT